MWNVLMPVFDVRELYDNRYKKLMDDRQIGPELTWIYRPYDGTFHWYLT